MLNTVNYLTYIAFSLFITVYVSHTLSRNGLAFLVEGFKGNAHFFNMYVIHRISRSEATFERPVR
jgi:hypothetical protein